MARGSILTRTLENGKKRYDTVIRVNGKQQWKTFKKKKEAEDYLDRHSTDVRDGTYREMKKATFGEYVDHWRQTHLLPESFKPFAINGYLSNLGFHIVPVFENCPLTAISPAEINILKAQLLKGNRAEGRKPVSRKTARNVLNLMGKIFCDAVRDGYLRVSPMGGVERPKIDRERKGRALQPR